MNINHTDDPVLHGWKSIAKFLKISEATAKKAFKKYNIETFSLGRSIAIYPSSLKDQLEQHSYSLSEQNLKEEMLIYFVQAEDHGIKIGITNNIETRLRALQRSCPINLTLLGMIKGDVEQENKLHRKYEKYKIHGEWFEVQKEILAYIKRYKND